MASSLTVRFGALDLCQASDSVEMPLRAKSSSDRAEREPNVAPTLPMPSAVLLSQDVKNTIYPSSPNDTTPYKQPIQTYSPRYHAPQTYYSPPPKPFPHDYYPPAHFYAPQQNYPPYSAPPPPYEQSHGQNHAAYGGRYGGNSVYSQNPQMSYSHAGRRLPRHPSPPPGASRKRKSSQSNPAQNKRPATEQPNIPDDGAPGGVPEEDDEGAGHQGQAEGRER